MIRLLLLLYPSRWRRRYGAEMRDLVTDDGISAATVLDLIRGALRERGRAFRAAVLGGGSMVIGPAWRHPTAWAFAALAIVAPTLVFVALSMLAYQFGFASLQGVMDPVNAWLNGRRALDLILVAAPAVALLAAVAPLLRVELRTTDAGREATVGLRVRALNLVIGAVAVAVGALLVGHILVESVLQLGA